MGKSTGLTKFKVGDTVVCIANRNVSCGADREKFRNGTLKTELIFNGLYKIVKYKNEDYGEFVEVVSLNGDGIIINGTHANQFELKEIKTNKTIMGTITEFAKNLTLSADEKALRKVGLKTECGDYTAEAQSIVIQTLCKEREAMLVEIANKKIDEDKNK